MNPISDKPQGRRSPVRCAIYTRKSSEEGLEQGFNSLDAQREACEAYIKNQAHQGWKLLPARFDDGGHSGGTLERPALQQLLELVRGRRLDVIVIYKIDRLTRSLGDFARLAEMFEQYGVSFVSVTQQFNTTTSMGRLMLNVLLSFAQFERELTGERIRDKVAASKKKGLWMGGNVPLGYDSKDKALVVNESEAKTVRTIFRLYLEYGSVRAVAAEAKRLGIRTKVRVAPDGRKTGGKPFFPGHFYEILKNPIYIGRIRHKGQVYPGAHAPILDEKTWDAVQQKIAENRVGDRTGPNRAATSILIGLLVDAQGNRFTPSHTITLGRRYRYYVDRDSKEAPGIEGKAKTHPTAKTKASSKPRRIPAEEIENAVRAGIDGMLDSQIRLFEALGSGLDAAASDRAIQRAQGIRQELRRAGPAAWIARVRPMLSQVVFGEDSLCLRLNRDGLRAALSLPSAPFGEGNSGETYDLGIPARITARGYRIKLVVGNDGNHGRRAVDAALVKVIARAHDWFERIKAGQASSVREIAKTEGMNEAYVGRVLRLAFLAPALVEAILDGRQPVEMTAERMLQRRDWPLGVGRLASGIRV